MVKHEFTFPSADSKTNIHAVSWLPDGTPVAVLQIAHGISEYVLRYEPFAQYLTEQGFQPVRMEDCTEGFGGSGNLLLMVPQDTVKRKLYGYEGYFLRFVCLDSDYAEYELPVIRGIYPNMAAVINVNTETEEFYLENREEAAQFQLSRQNLLNIRVEVLEQRGGSARLSVTIHEGKNRQIRRMCAACGLTVQRLQRVREHTLELGDLPVGTWRPLTEAELAALKNE